MDRERWHRVTGIFHSALDLPAASRAAYVADACGGDASLRAEVEALLAGDAAAPRESDPLAPSSRIRVGAVLGPYLIEALVGAGGMGEVYRARDTRLNRPVALKVLPHMLQQDATVRERFTREARAIASLNHPNICVLHNVDTDAGIDVLVMEYLEGETLQHRLEAGALPLDTALSIGVQIADALAAAHRAGVLHRDLKPANVVLTRSGAKVVDFGLAKFTPVPSALSLKSRTPAPLTVTGTIVGTPQYMAPEQVEGREADSRTDVFALGCVLYEMFTGRAAFSAATPAGLLASILRDDPPAMSSVRAQLPAGLDPLVGACLAKESDERMQAAHDVGLQLRWIREHRAPDERGRRRWNARSLSLLTSLILAATMAAVAFGSATIRRITAPPPHATFRQLTFRQGVISAARFSPDGQSIVYSAAWDGAPEQMYSMRVDTAESTALPVPPGSVFAISRSGELAMRIHGNRDTLARVPLGGGGPRELLDGVLAADWSPDGAALAVLRRDGPQESIEYPIGRRLLTTAAKLTNLRVSPDGNELALVEIDSAGGGWVDVVDRAGHLTRLSRQWPSMSGDLAWTPSASEIWFSASEVGLNLGLHAVARNGRERVIQRTMGSAFLLDIGHDGRALLTHEIRRGGISGWIDGQERDLSWLDFSRPSELSPDGATLLFTESGAAAGATPILFLRRTDGSPAIRLLEGEAVGLSPDGTSVAVRSPDGKTLTIVPVGSGQARTIDIGQLTVLRYGAWLPNGAALVVNASLPNRPPRAFLQSLTGAGARPITPEGVIPSAPVVVSPDSRFLLARDRGATVMYPIAGGTPTPLEGVLPGETPVRWSPDGGVLWVRGGTRERPQIVRLALATRARRVWKEITFPDRGGLLPEWFRLLASADGRTFVYGYVRVRQELYTVDDLR